MKRLLLPITVLLLLALAGTTCVSQKQVAKVGTIAVNIAYLDLQINLTPTSATQAGTSGCLKSPGMVFYSWLDGL